MSARSFHKDLVRRLGNKEYTNWIKAGQCLCILAQSLHPFMDSEMRSFHVELLNQNSMLREACERSCRPSGNKLCGLCRFCSEWQRVIQTHQRQPQNIINWDNCSPASWRTNHWEVAKAFMPRGQGRVKGADQFDASALLNLINSCDWFHTVDPRPVRELIRHRNELMHSSDFLVRDEWMTHFHSALRTFIAHFGKTSLATAGQQIKRMLRTDLSIHINGLDQTDAVIVADSVDEEISADLIVQWEAELLLKRLQEEETNDASALSAEELKKLGGFFEANEDLSEHFSSQLQNMDLLKKQE